MTRNTIRKNCRRYNALGHAHFLTFSCFHRQAFLRQKTATAWLADSLTRASLLHDIALLGYVFMPEHVHLLVHPRQSEYSISDFLRSVKQSVTRKAMHNRDTSAKPQVVWQPFLDIQPNGEQHFRFWQRGGGYDRNIWSTDEILEKLNYIHANPVRRGLCTCEADWEWSSAADYAGLRAAPIPVEKLEI